MVQFTVIGSLNYDLVSYTSRVPRAGETFQADAFETHIGGKGLNQTIALAKLLHDENSSVRMIGTVGDDSFGTELRAALSKFGVDISAVEVLKNQSSGVAVIMVEKDTGENRILITSGANSHSTFTDEELCKLFPLNFSEKQVVVFQNEIPGTADIITWLHNSRNDIEIVYNPSPYYSWSADLIPYTDILIVNEGEALSVARDILPQDEISSFERLIEEDMLKGYNDLSQTLHTKIHTRNSQIVLVTLGSKGAICRGKGSVTFVPAASVLSVVDTTGAGDTFLGAFTTQIFTGSDVEASLKFAINASALAIQKKGASDSIPTYADVKI